MRPLAMYEVVRSGATLTMDPSNATSLKFGKLPPILELRLAR